MDNMNDQALPPPWVQALLDHQNARMEMMESALKTLIENQGLGEAPPATPTHDSIPEPELSSQVVIKRPRTRLPDPAKFSGDRSEWPSWKVTMENKLTLDGESIGDLNARFLYVHSRLEGNAWKNVTTYVKQYRTTGNPEHFFAYLDSLYGDPNAQARAATKLHRLKQGEKQPFAKFLPLLEKEFADAGALDWPDAAKRPILLTALNSTMSEKLVSRGIPQDFSDIIRRLHEISNDIDMMSMKNPRQEYRHDGESRAKASTIRPLKEEVYEPMDWVPSTPSQISTTRVNPEGYRSGRAEDRPLYGKRAKWVNRETLEERKKDGRCLRCGRSDCSTKRCPLKPAVRPNGSNTSPRPKAAKVMEALYEDDTPEVSTDEEVESPGKV